MNQNVECYEPSKQIIIRVGDYILTRAHELLQVEGIVADGVIVYGGREICCNDILDVKEWEDDN